MQEKEQKISINVENGVKEVVIREGEAARLLDEKAPLKAGISGTLDAPLEYITQRLEQFDHKRAHILVDRENATITLVINENDPYRRDEIKGALEMHPAFQAFGINAGKVWTPTQLGMFFKMNRAYFADRAENLKLVSELMNFTATVNNSIERSMNEKGNRTDNFEQVVNSNLPASFVLNIPIVKGGQAEKLEVETFAQVDGREVSFVLLSPSARELTTTLLDNAIDGILQVIRDIASDIAIIEQ